ncbi:MAG: hypothetical protein JSW60_08885 [Thermoplasmatales archaeon]|nr:MAG: hypothetical protein JSW60_08885 [Thermoplasmatales archaeon]
MVPDINKNRYLYKCSCDQLKKRPLVLRILSIINESNKKWITKGEINEIGKAKYPDWPADRNTMFRALKSMHKCDYINEKKRGRGQATYWSLNKKKISTREIMIHEIKQLEYVVSRLPQLVFENEYFLEEINKNWQLIRKILVNLQDHDIACNRAIFNLMWRKLISSPSFDLLDRQLAMIYIFCLLIMPEDKLLEKWFDKSQIPFSIKADFDLADIFKKHFYPEYSQSTLIEKLDKHKLCPGISIRLLALMKMYYDTLHLDYEYSFKSFDKDKFSFLRDDEFEKYQETIDDEKLKVSLIRHFRTNILLELMKKPDYTLEEIDLFIANYKESLQSPDKKKKCHTYLVFLCNLFKPFPGMARFWWRNNEKRN